MRFLRRPSVALLVALLGLAGFLGSALAQGGSSVFPVISELASEHTRRFMETSLLQAEQTIAIDGAGSDFHITYSADAPFELWVAFPVARGVPTGGEELQSNFLHLLKVRLEPADHARIAIDLTQSPAWSPGRQLTLLHVFGKPGSTVLLHEVERLMPTTRRTLGAALRHFAVDEPVLLSSINFLWGYRVLDRSFTTVLGVLFLFLVGIFALLRRNFARRAVLLAVAFLLLYDARFGLDLARATALDLREWYGAHEYRHLGPVHSIANFLRGARASFESPMEITVCYDGTDFLLKQLRYLLYPTHVQSAAENWEGATHVVFIDTDRGVLENGIASCGDRHRGADLLQSFSRKSSVLRFTDRAP